MISLTIKLGLLSEALDFKYSALIYQQSGFWQCFQYLTCTIPILWAYFLVFLTLWFCQGIQSLGVNQRFLFSLNVVLICTVSFMIEKDANSICTSKDNPQKQDIWNFISNEIYEMFCPGCDRARVRSHEHVKSACIQCLEEISQPVPKVYRNCWV